MMRLRFFLLSEILFMIDEKKNGLIFHEEQRFGIRMRVLVAASDLLAIIVLLIVFSKVKDPSRLPPTYVLVLLVVVSIAAAVFYWKAKLETLVDSQALYVRFFPFQLAFRKFVASDLAQYHCREYKPGREYGGWGIRVGKSGKAYIASGNKGVQLVMSDGKPVLIGSQRPDELVAAIDSFMKTR